MEPTEAKHDIDLTDVIVTSDLEKLPPHIAALLDKQKPLPMGVQFFEKEFTDADWIKTIAWAAGLGVVGVLTTLFGVALIFQTMTDRYAGAQYGVFGFGVVCLFAAWMMIASVKTIWSSKKLQSVGQPTRIGTYLVGASLFEVSANDYVLIPRSHFRGLTAGTVKYQFKEQEKSFRLPAIVLNAKPEQRDAAIEAWANAKD